jgi:hypothetical protein
MIAKQKLENINNLIKFHGDAIDEHIKIVATEIYNQVIVPFMAKHKLKIRYGMGCVYFEDERGNYWDDFMDSNGYKKSVKTLFDDISNLCSNFKFLKSDINSSVWKIVGWYVMPEEKK